MIYRSKDECEKSFRQIESMLDSAFSSLKEVFPEYKAADNSNRSGFEKSGYPYFVWNCTLSTELSLGEELERHGVSISYFESFELHNESEVTIGAFMVRHSATGRQTGAAPLASDRSECTMNVSEATLDGLLSLAHKYIRIAQGMTKNKR